MFWLVSYHPAEALKLHDDFAKRPTGVEEGALQRGALSSSAVALLRPSPTFAKHSILVEKGAL